MFSGRARSIVIISTILLLAGAALFHRLYFTDLSTLLDNRKSFYHSANGEALVQEIFDAHSAPIEQVSVHFLDVGNADCIFIDAGDIDILLTAAMTTTAVYSGLP